MSDPSRVVLRFWGPDLGQPAEWHDYCPWSPLLAGGRYAGGQTERWSFGPRWHWCSRLLALR